MALLRASLIYSKNNQKEASFSCGRAGFFLNLTDRPYNFKGRIFILKISDSHLRMHFRLFFLGMVCFLASDAQDTLVPKPNIVNRLIDFGKKKYEKIANADRLLIPFPILTRQPETGWVAGAAVDYYFKPRDSAVAAITRPSFIYASITYSQLKQLQTDLQWQAFTAGNKYFLKGQISYVNNYDRFWGIGNRSPESDRSEYTFNRTKIQLRGMRQIAPSVYVGAVAQADWYTKVDWFNLNDAIDLDSLSGSGENRLIGVGPSFLYDSRDNPYSPSKGWYTEFQTIFFLPALGSEFGFERILLDLRKYIPIGKKTNHLVAIQNIWNFSIGPEIPFRELGRLGSQFIMRGYFNGRFKDRHMVEAQAEYRFPVWNILTGATFFSMGRVAAQPGDLFGGKFHYSYGLGPRLTVNKKQRISLRVDIAFNEFGQTEFYARFFEAF